jgi:hypothetical protein
MGFRENFARFGQPSYAREKFILDTLTRLPRNVVVKTLKPITVSKSNGTKITYEVMPDYISIEGMRVPMSGTTAQRVADHFGLNLPTPKMVDEIYQNADVQVQAQPLSGHGATIDGKQYSGKEVVDKGVGYAPFAMAYNDRINQQLTDKGVGADDDKIVAGFAKDIVPPVREGSLGLYGFYNSKGKPIQGGNGQTPHDTKAHAEYGTFVRLVSPTVTITYPDGKIEKKPLGDVYQYARYAPTPKTTGVEAPMEPDISTQVAEYTPKKPEDGRMQFLRRIDDFLSQFKV